MPGSAHRAPPARPGSPARPAMAAAVDESALPSISTFANLLPLEQRPADMLHVSTGQPGRWAARMCVGRVGGYGAERPRLRLSLAGGSGPSPAVGGRPEDGAAGAVSTRRTG